MKRVLFLLSLFVVSSGAFAQGVKGGLKGPAAKNYKYWLDDNKPVATEVVTADSEPLQGPAAKNAKWHKRSVENNYLAIETVERPRLVGPKAKNSKPTDFRYSKLEALKDASEDQDKISSRNE